MVVETFENKIIAWDLHDDGTLVIKPPTKGYGLLFDLQEIGLSQYLDQINSIKFEPGVQLFSMSYNLFRNIKADVIDLTNLDMTTCLEITDMFKDSIVYKVILGDFNCPKVTTLHSMFSHATIDRIIINSMNIPELKSINEMFFSSNIMEVDLTNCDFSHVEMAYDMFSSCTIENLGLPLAPKYLDIDVFYKSEIDNIWVNSREDLERWKKLGLEV